MTVDSQLPGVELLHRGGGSAFLHGKIEAVTSVIFSAFAQLAFFLLSLAEL